jgi:phosphoglycolate phosphatase-like HAD superfamily hydrolase
MDRLVVFDVDGTLCDTCSVDDEIFCTTTSAQLGVPIHPWAWHDAPHVTDTGISAWLWTQHRGRVPTAAESEEFAVAFEAALRAERDRAPQRFAPIAGARLFLDHLIASGWRYAIATGGRARTAGLKLEAAGLPTDRLLASSDDSPDRREIFDLARRRLVEREGGTPTRIVLVGDGVWDLRTAAQLGWSMVGIGITEGATRLREAGASTVISDFTNHAAALAAVEHASVPGAG